MLDCQDMRRLVRITDAANRIAGGDTSQPLVDDEAQDEIGALAQAFNRMVTELNRVSAENAQLVASEHERLEDLVSERTRALEQSREMFRLVAESTNGIPFTLDLTSMCSYRATRIMSCGGISTSAAMVPSSS
jgi:nitrate/nitrite-specific signal transduction histidine kinase